MIELEDWVAAQVATPQIVDYGQWNKPTLGGSMTRTDRPGNRFSCDFTLPPVLSDAQGARLLSDLIVAKREGLRFRWPTGSFTAPLVGSPVIDGASVQGTSVPLRGLLANAVIRKGQFFTIEHDGGAYLHNVRSEVIANSSGEATVIVEPELRVILDDGDVCEFAEPYIEGVIEDNTWSWSYRIDKRMEISFMLMERA